MCQPPFFCLVEKTYNIDMNVNNIALLLRWRATRKRNTKHNARVCVSVDQPYGQTDTFQAPASSCFCQQPSVTWLPVVVVWREHSFFSLREFAI